MKRILSLVLVLLLSLTVMVGCDKVPGLQKVTDKVTDFAGKIPFIGDLINKNEEPDEEPDEVTYDVEAAVEYVRTLYITGTATTETGAVVTSGDYEVVGQVMVAGVKYTVEWSVDNDKVKLIKGETTWTVDVDNRAPEAHDYKLTATVVAEDGSKGAVTFDRHVPMYNPITFEQYMAAEKGATVTVEGIVVAMTSESLNNKYNHLFLADASGNGGYYVYDLAADPVKLGIKVGMTVGVTSTVEPYSGMQELKGGSAIIVDKTIKTVEPKDITELVKNGESVKNYVGLVVTMKGVTIGTQELEKETSQYLNFTIGDKTSYIRTYVTDFPTTFTLTKDGNTVSCADKKTIDEAHAAKFGWTANATGILVLYNSNPYLIPMGTDCFEYLEFVEKTPAEKVAYEKGSLTFETNITTDTVIDLVLKGTNYPEVTITWSTEDANIVIADGKATVTIPEEAVTAKITATLTCGEATDTKEFEVKLSKSITPIPEATEIGVANPSYTAGKYLLAGVITGLYGKEESAVKYGNVYITDENGNSIIVYGLWNADGTVRYDALEKKPGVGDYITVLGILGAYNGTAQMKDGWIVSHTTETSIPAASEIGVANPNYTADKYLVSGVISALYGKEESAVKYGNVIIKDAEGNEFIVYGLYNSTGETRYDAMTTKPVVGDTITVYGILGAYNGTAQMKDGWLVAHTVATPEGGEGEGGEGETPVDPTPGEGEGETTVNYGTLEAPVTTTEAVNACKDFADGDVSAERFYVTGTVTKITSTGSFYSQVYITDGTTELLIYTISMGEGITGFTKNDTITAYGYIKNYGGTIEMASHKADGTNNTYVYAVAVVDSCAAGHDFTDATCTAPKTCKVCDTTEGETADHVYVDGKCSSCGADEPTGEEPVATGFYLKSEFGGTTYYFAGTASGGIGAITTDATKAALVYKEEVTGGYYLYILDSTGAKKYINIGSTSKSFSLTATPQLLQDYTGDGYTAIYDSVDGRALANYKGNDLRTYAASSANNFNGTNGTPFLLVEA